MELNIAIVDDHPILRIGFKIILEESKYVLNSYTFESGKQFLSEVVDLNIDIVFVDLLMPEMDGIETTSILKKRHPNIKVIAFTSMSDLDSVEKMMQEGANGYILKGASLKEVNDAIQTVANNGNYFSMDIIAEFSRRTSNALSPNNTLKNIGTLTTREKEILPYLCAGFGREAIAQKLFISTRTVDKHRENILNKTESENISVLIVKCIMNKIFSTDKISKLHTEL
ncbi:response regulator transcription factor [Carboxylicivirga sp. M1479]|uniref:response regulator transcription factor n=1 Tax=Carboxylicivirga sp. M1479 TaxID=2594476 RepID=UPI0011785277|nr:response regulator transcription factor [Carboxylicivirga sp. M1479]TRX62497.1 response regulator transcription factor [Carboxylicivirga sp. M1479]